MSYLDEAANMLRILSESAQRLSHQTRGQADELDKMIQFCTAFPRKVGGLRDQRLVTVSDTAPMANTGAIESSTLEKARTVTAPLIAAKDMIDDLTVSLQSLAISYSVEATKLDGRRS